MSAGNLIIASDCAHIISDALIWDTDSQEILALCPKTILLPHLHCAATVRSTSFAAFQTLALALSTSTAGSYDELKAGIVDLVREVDRNLKEVGVDGAFELSVAGFSESTGPNGFRITTLEVPPGADADTIQPWTIIEMPRGFNPNPCKSRADEEEIRAAIERAPRSLDGHAVAALQAQRAIAIREAASGLSPCWVGGFAQLTTIDADGVHSRIIHRWPDTVGEKVAA